MSTDQDLSFAVTVTAVDGKWKVTEYDEKFRTINSAVNAVRGLRAEGPAFAMLCVEDDYFVIVRPNPSGVKLLVSDATAALDDALAESALDLIDAEMPTPDDDPYADGDFDLLEDLGLAQEVLMVIADDADAWPTDQLQQIADELGFGDHFADALGLD